MRRIRRYLERLPTTLVDGRQVKMYRLSVMQRSMWLLQGGVEDAKVVLDYFEVSQPFRLRPHRDAGPASAVARRRARLALEWRRSTSRVVYIKSDCAEYHVDLYPKHVRGDAVTSAQRRF